MTARLKKRFCLTHLLLMVAILMLSGCTSFRATQVQRGADGSFSGHNLATRSKGIPVKMKVPSHVEVEIEETFWIVNDSDQVIIPKNRILDIKTKPIYSYQMFTIDVVRPFAGTLNMTGTDGFGFDAEQYLSSLGATITDKTISDITDVIGGDDFKGLVSGAKTSTRGGRGLSPQTRTLVVKRFDISVPNWHELMNAWIEDYMRGCHGTCPNDCQPCVQNDADSDTTVSQFNPQVIPNPPFPATDSNAIDFVSEK